MAEDKRKTGPAHRRNILAAGEGPHLFRPIAFRGVEARNRIVVSPMCQYSAREGLPNDWHLVHLGSFAVGGAGIVFTEATAVEPRGRISPACLGLWNEQQRDAFANIVRFVEGQGAVAGIQLGHAGRKASTTPPFEGGRPLPEAGGGWPIVGPAAVPYSEAHAMPHALTPGEIDEVAAVFAHSTRLAREAGFRVVEVHAAHGYLLHSFLSPLSNTRTDDYGGPLAQRARALMQVLDAVRGEWPAELPLFVRVSCSDWVAESGWALAETIELVRLLAARGDVDLIDCSSGGNSPQQRIPVHPGYQVPFAEAVRRETGMATGAVGLIRAPQMAEEILANERADVVVLARVLLDDPRWPLHAARALGVDVPWPKQYARGDIVA